MCTSRRIAPVALVLAVTLFAGTAAAHDGHIHWIMGTVTQADASRVLVKPPGGEARRRDDIERGALI
jgi:hypothetical protein